MVLNCARRYFYQYANHLPNHLLSIELKYPDFFPTLLCKLLFIRWISLETKISILNSQMLAFWGTPFILAIKILKAKLQTFHSNVLMRES